MNSTSIKSTVAFAVIFVGFIAVFFLSLFVEEKRPPLPPGFEDEDLALQGAKIKGYALGFEGLIADWYWMKSLQYLGDKIVKSENGTGNLKPLNPRLLYPMLDNATTLDPQYLVVYSYGANILPEIDDNQAIKLTEKGIENNPTQWRLYHYLGYIYWKREDYEKAAQIYEQGSQIEGAPNWMKLMVGNLRTQGGSRETARTIYEEMLAESLDEQTKESASLRLLELDSLDERDAIRSALKSFQSENNRCANSLREIFPLLQTVKLPNGEGFRIDKSNNLVDPSDAPYILDKEKCDVLLDKEKTKIPFQSAQ